MTASQGLRQRRSDPDLHPRRALQRRHRQRCSPVRCRRAAGEDVGTYAIHLGHAVGGPELPSASPPARPSRSPRPCCRSTPSPSPRSTAPPTRPRPRRFSGFVNGDAAERHGSPGGRAAHGPPGENVGRLRPTRSPAPRATSRRQLQLRDRDQRRTSRSPPRTLIVTPDDGQSKVYGSVDPTLTYTHGTLYNGDTDACSPVRCRRAAGENVGTYAITSGTLSAGSNYAISFTTGRTFAITQAELSVNAVAKSKTYGATDPALDLHLQWLPGPMTPRTPGSPGSAAAPGPPGETSWARPTRSPARRDTLVAPNYSFADRDPPRTSRSPRRR